MTPEALIVAAGSETGRVLEVGTRRWGLEPTHHRAMFPNVNEYIMSDFMDGTDVDVVSDLHDLNEFADDSFDGFYAASVFEHVQFPWVAAAAIYRVLKPGGWCYVATHQTFPVHGYPNDYNRWTDQGLRSLFEWNLFTVESAEMNTRCKIQKPAEVPVWDEMAPAFIGVSVFARKPLSTQ